MRTRSEFFALPLTPSVSHSSTLCDAVGLVVRSSSLFPVSVKILKVLGEGGFSFVYLCQDETSGVSLTSRRSLCSPVAVLTVVLQREFALKKIRCPTGSEDVRQAMREVETYRRFKCVGFYISHLSPAVLIEIWMVI